VRALDYLMRGGATGVFNLGNGRGFSVMEVIRAAAAVTGLEVLYSIAERRPGDPPVLVASSTRARETLGWQPGYTDLAAIIETAWRWHRQPRF
jgi:UDP-glucose 4-epimerase